MTTVFEENVELAPYTTFKIGGKARYFIEASDEDRLVDGLRFAAEKALPVFILGGGSNVLIADEGFDGLVIRVGMLGRTEVRQQDGRVLIASAAGEDWDGFVKHCVENNFAGVECLSGIPGLVGGTPVQNVGAYGQEVSETIVSVRCFDRRNDRVVELTNQQCEFSYRTSIFNSTCRDRYVVLQVMFRLVSGGFPKLVYKDLLEYFNGEAASLAEVREAVLKIRRSKSMVIDADDPNSRSAGSFFKNPIVPLSRYQIIADRSGPTPKFPFDDENVKIPAAWLIEKAGFEKGFVAGGAGISTKHTLAIVNRGHATASEVLSLRSLIEEKVAEHFGIELQAEPLFVGFS